MAIKNIHRHLNEVIKVANSINVSNMINPDQNKDEIKLFTHIATSKFIIESKNERKCESIKQILNTLESLQDFLVSNGNTSISRINNNDYNSINSSKLLVNNKNVLRSALGVSTRRPWLSELKIEDMFKMILYRLMNL